MIDSEPFDILLPLHVLHSQAESQIVILLVEVLILLPKYYFLLLQAINYDCLSLLFLAYIFLLLVSHLILVIFCLGSTDVEGDFKGVSLNFILIRNFIDCFC